MGNYKDMMAFIESLDRKCKPFLIIKYETTFCGSSNTAYEIVTICSKKLRYMSIERSLALDAIRKFGLPLLHSLSNRNMVWGSENFREVYHEKNCSL